MYCRKLLPGLAFGLILLGSPAFAADGTPANAAETHKNATSTARSNANLPDGVIAEVFTIMPPETDIIITLPPMFTEQGIVESVDAGKNTFELKRKDGSVVKIRVSDHTVVENVYADVFHREDKKGMADLKKGDKVRARVFVPQNVGDVENALLLDVYHL